MVVALFPRWTKTLAMLGSALAPKLQQLLVPETKLHDGVCISSDVLDHQALG